MGLVNHELAYVLLFRVPSTSNFDGSQFGVYLGACTLTFLFDNTYAWNEL